MQNFFNKTKQRKKYAKKSESLKNETKLYTLIQSGKYKGKKLLLPSLSTTRSTKNIVRTCIFNVLRGDLKDKIFIEAFGGSALVAAEALSNGVLKSYAIELDLKAYQIALKNAQNLDTNLEIIHADTFHILAKLIENSQNEIILYLDPPFDIREGFKSIYEKIYKLLNPLNLKALKLIILEHRSNVNTPDKIQNFQKIKEKKFGFTSLSFYSL